MKDGYRAHEIVIVKGDRPKKYLLVGGAHPTIASLFLFTHVTCKVVAKYCGSKNSLTKVVQLTEPIMD